MMIDADDRRDVFREPLGQEEAMPRRVQYLRGLGGGTSVAADSPTAQ